jgi:tetratricopeptide (TPR) repeat protein
MDSRVRATGPVGQASAVVWPVRSGAAPPLADGFSARPETAPALGSALVPGAAVALVAGQNAPAGSPDWVGTCGKTQLAAFFTESLWRSRGIDLLVWASATSRASVLSAYTEAAAATGSDHVGDAESVAARFVGWLGQTSRPWLVVLDDLTDPADMEDLWPENSVGRVLVTAANPAAVSGDHRMPALPVRAFSTREALSYLMGRLTADPDQRIGAIDLVSDLGCEPFALAQASAVIASSGLSCRDYRDYFAQRRGQLAEVGVADRSAVAVTWTLSVEQAERLAPGGGAQHLLAMAALLDGHLFPGEVFTSSASCRYVSNGIGGTVDARRVWATMLSLERVGLLSIDATGPAPSVRVNSAVQAAVRLAAPQVMLDRAAQAAADALLEIWPEEEPHPWTAAALRSSARTLLQHAGDALWTSGTGHPILLRAGQSMDGARLTGPAVEYWRDLAAASDRIVGPGSPDTLMAGNRLAGALRAAGLAKEAIAWAQWVLAGRGRVLGPEHPSTIAARVDLGRAYVAAGQSDAALPILEQGAGDWERARGAESPEALEARDEFAAACLAAGRTADATRLYRRTLADRERIQGPHAPDTMKTRQRLADAYLAEGKTKDAISQLKRLVNDRERVLGPDHLNTIVARGSLAAAYHKVGRMASALQLYEQACTGYERVLGADNPETLARRGDLAHAYYTVGRLSDATAMLRDTVERCERALPPGDPLTQTLRESLTNIAGA